MFVQDVEARRILQPPPVLRRTNNDTATHSAAFIMLELDINKTNCGQNVTGYESLLLLDVQLRGSVASMVALDRDGLGIAG